ncbi:unnamed protein product [Dibothriocephalus latus]|uniref:Uncharacterized protein n=1 Tax=Dibothriocephalus latus TaxID=60516 RepID=A0A3P7MBP9_DIBLA|nr:unnamed protein product [Dibothriocephalus latus]
MVKRFNRQLKVFLRAAGDPEDWTDHIPLVIFVRILAEPNATNVWRLS